MIKIKKNIYYLCTFIISLSIISCNSGDDEVDTAWKNTNEAAFNALKNDTAYQKASIPNGGNENYVYYKIIESGSKDSAAIAITGNTISTAYTGKRFVDDVQFDSSTNFKFTIKKGDVIDGWLIAIQNMRPGDRWEVVIPWHLAYRHSGNAGIPGYTCLHFDIHLKEIIE
ncbi:hypothetical protein AwDysgo_19260 [Bacteroidales bacterium]|nr:hypothetical protein AwDysgo_19260 [Bacteroidales bacterium]